MNLATKQAAMRARRGKEPDPVTESKVRVAIYLLWRSDPSLTEEQIGRRFDRGAAFVRRMIEENFPLLG
ncbi:MAG: hypothetical protein WAN65_04700 [Candidatus Sulfotelmatobacter sp.]